MRAPPSLVVLSFLLALSASGCAGPKGAHFFPRLRPLFAGLDEAGVPAKSKAALAEAKADFQLARQGKEPRHARCMDTDPRSQSKIYQGRGYRLTMVHDHAFYAHSDGPRIVIDPSIAGGTPYRYDEVDGGVD